MNRLRNILIAICTLLFAVWRGDAKKRVVPKSIVVVSPTNNIGDMVCVTPVFRAIKEHNPAIRVIVIGSLKNESLLAYNTDIDEYIVNTIPFWTIIQYIKKNKIDSGVVLGNNVFDFALLFFCGIKSISCFTLTEKYRGMEARPYKLVLRLAHGIEYFPGEYVPEQYLKLLNPFGVSVSGIKKHLEHSLVAKEFAIQKFSEMGFGDRDVVVIAPGAGALYKQWPPERFAQVANYLYEKHDMAIVIVGSASDADAVTKTINAIHKRVKYWNPGAQSLDQLKATLACSCLVIGNDSGAIHVGEALERATITIAGPADDTEHMLPDMLHRVVRAPTKTKPLYQAYVVDETNIDISMARAQMEAVTTEVVCREVDDLILRISAKRKF